MEKIDSRNRNFLSKVSNLILMEKLSSWRDLRNFSTNRCILNFEQNARYRSKRLIFIYRPSNASIIWTHNGGCKFINQHDFVYRDLIGSLFQQLYTRIHRSAGHSPSICPEGCSREASCRAWKSRNPLKGIPFAWMFKSSVRPR